MSKFVIFEDQENLTDKAATTLGESKRDRQKLAPLTNKAINNENAFENQAAKYLKPSAPTKPAEAFKQRHEQSKNVEAKQQLKVEEVYEHEFSIVNVTSDSVCSSDSVELGVEATTSFSYRKAEAESKDALATPMSVGITTPMSIDKSTMDVEQAQKSIIRNDRDRFFEAVEYQNDILSYLKQAEVQKNLRPRAEYMTKQPDINDSMRSILVDWLVEVSEEYRLQGETLCLAVNYIDRFLSFMSVVRAKLQLVGTAAMFIASKYEEIYPPEIGEFVYITDDTYTKQQVLRMEKLLLKVLSFDLCAPSSHSFISLFSCMMNIPDKVKFLAQYLCELSLLKALPFLNYVPSQLSSAALALAYYNLGSSIWNKKMRDTFGYELDDLKDVIVHLSEIHHEAEAMAQQAIQDKYKGSKYMNVSCIEPKKIIAEDLNDIINKLETSDELNTTAENIECVRQKTEMLFN